MATIEQLHVDGAALKRIHDLLKKDIGAVKILFSTGPKPNTHYIKDITEDIATQYGLDASEKAAALYLVSLGRVKGTETAEYTAFLNVLRHPAPKPPSDNSVFLPYLSFLCTPSRKKVVRDDSLIDSKNYDPADKGLLMPAHPQCVEKPAPPQRNALTELTSLLHRAGDKVSLAAFSAIMKDVDRNVTPAEIRRLYTEACTAGGGSAKVDEKTTVSGSTLLEVCRPQLTMERQKQRSSSLVKGAFTWGIPSPPPANSQGASTKSKNATSSGNNSPRSPRSGSVGGAQAASSRSSSNSSARKGFQPTKSAELRLQLSKDQLNDPTSPYYNKGVYKHIPAVPESHYKKQGEMNLTSRYAVKGSTSPRRPAAEMNGDSSSAAEAQRQKDTE